MLWGLTMSGWEAGGLARGVDANRLRMGRWAAGGIYWLWRIGYRGLAIGDWLWRDCGWVDGHRFALHGR